MFVLTLLAMGVYKMVGSKVIREKLIIIKGMGLQIESETLQGSVVGRRFIDLSRVRDKVINEVSWFK